LKGLIGWVDFGTPDTIEAPGCADRGYILLVSGENLGSRHQELTAQAAPDSASKND
jgi:hypothetical protein